MALRERGGTASVAGSIDSKGTPGGTVEREDTGAEAQAGAGVEPEADGESAGALPDLKSSMGREDWSTWPVYASSALGLPGSWWYPVMWSEQVTDNPVGIKITGRNVMFVRDHGKVYALHDRCPHRGVPLSLGKKQFPRTLSCPYHGWTYDLSSGVLAAVITDGPDSPICGKVRVQTYPVEERLGLVWIFIGDSDGRPPPVEVAIPRELLENEFSLGGRIDVRSGGWRFAAENGFDEGHAKYLHRNSLWRLFKMMPTWTKTRVIPTEGGWITRVQDEAHWDATFPGLGTWTSKRWWRRGGQMLHTKPSQAAKKVDPVIAALDVPGNQHIRLPGLLRIVHTRFIHYEWYVPVDEDLYRYIQMFVEFKTGQEGFWFKLRYLAFIRWLFHGQFTGQDGWMVNVMDAPPERLYRPDVSITRWRALCESAPPDGHAIVDEASANGQGAQTRPEAEAARANPL
jgi:phenylpropionate dioxygenase-like ring-hydroxylating dioxygenase large terminal subunit